MNIVPGNEVMGVLNAYQERIKNERIPAYSYRGWKISHYLGGPTPVGTEQGCVIVESEEKFMACRGAKVLRHSTKQGIESLVDSRQ